MFAGNRLHTFYIRKPKKTGSLIIAEPKTNVVVAVVGAVVVTVSRPTILRVVVPTAAAYHTVRALLANIP